VKPRRPCSNCACTFHGEPWQRLCWSSWREKRDAEERDGEYRRGYRAGLITQAIALRHPDCQPPERHGLATTTTTRLLELRRELAA
jgi:hypothetical protein